MARLFTTGFEEGDAYVFTGFGGAAPTNYSIITTNVRTGLRAISIGSNCFPNITFTATSEVYLRFGFRFGGSASDTTILQLQDGSNIQILLSYICDSGLLRAWRGNKVTKLAEVFVPWAMRWYCIEVHLLVDNSSGVLQVKVNGELVLDYSGDTQQSANSTVDTVVWFGSANGQYFDDIAINDTSGSRNNSWIGRGGVYGLVPNGVGNYSEFTPSAGNNYECVDEVPPDGDTSYVESDTVGHKDSYALANLSLTSASIAALVWHVWAKQDVSDGRNVARLLRISGTDYQGADKALTTSYQRLMETIESNPHTSADWTLDDINGLELGFVSR